MNNSFWNWRSAPLLAAGLLSAVDLIWIAFIQIAGQLVSSGAALREEYLWHLYDTASNGWRVMHFPIQLFLEPLFFPAVVSHPSHVSVGAIVAFQVTCVLQWTIAGFVGAAVARGLFGLRRLRRR